MVSSVLLVSMLVPLVFLIGMIMVLCFRKKIKYREKITRILIYIIHASSIVLSISYLCLVNINISEFFRKFFVLYLPTTVMLFGFVFSVYQTLLTLILASVEITIIHTELETTKIEFILIICFFFLLFHAIIYALDFKITRVVLHGENDCWIHCVIGISHFIISVYNFIVACAILGTYAFIFLVHYSLILVFWPVSIGLCNLFKLNWELILLLINKITLASYVIESGIMAYIFNLKTFTIITPMITFFVPVIIHACFLLIKFVPRFSRMFHRETRIVFENDQYEIYWNIAKAKLLIKNEFDDIIRSSVTYDGIEAKVTRFDDFCLFDYRLDHITVQNPMISTKYNNIKRIKIDCRWTFNNISSIIESFPALQKIETTSNCRNLVSYGDKLFSINDLNLYYCSRHIRRLTINESCSGIQASACASCMLLKSVVFPPSVTHISKYAFKKCVMLRKISFHERSQLKWIGDEAFFQTDLRNVFFPKSLRTIGFEAFRNCINLVRIEFPDQSELANLAPDAFDLRDRKSVV